MLEINDGQNKQISSLVLDFTLSTLGIKSLYMHDALAFDYFSSLTNQSSAHVLFKGSNHTDFQNLVISSRKSDWDTSHTSCHSLAGEDVFCNEYNTSQKCRPEVTDFYNMSGLPKTFTAWIDSFLQTSYSITFDGTCCRHILFYK